MRLLLIVTFIATIFSLPVSAKEIWLDCENTILMLDTDKETFSYESGGVAFKGKAVFFSEQINFERIGNTGEKFTSKYKDEWSINRKSLSFIRALSEGHEFFRGSITWTERREASGKCKKIKPQNLI